MVFRTVFLIAVWDGHTRVQSAWTSGFAAPPVMGLFSDPQVMILITGAHKAFALYKAIEEGVNHMWTVSAFQQHPRTVFVCDEDATLELKVKTVKYFKGERGAGLGVGGQVQDMPGGGSGPSSHALDILTNSDFNKHQKNTQSFLSHN